VTLGSNAATEVLRLSVQMLNQGDEFELLNCTAHAVIEGMLDKKMESSLLPW
jgi:hypothetical protein